MALLGSPVVRPPVVRKQVVPTLAAERALWEEGCEVVVGVDEVGRGSWAGPISVGAAVLPRDKRVYKVRDSKMLTEPEREHLYTRLTGWCAAWAVGHASQAECDGLGMSAAQKLAARRAIAGLGVVPDAVLVDGLWDFVVGPSGPLSGEPGPSGPLSGEPGPSGPLSGEPGLRRNSRPRVKRIVKGDASCLSIATASVLAKVTRDRIMRAEAEHYPGYDFELNKGYPCPRHKAALAAWGPSAIHRRAWVFMDNLPWGGLPRYVRFSEGQESLWAGRTP